LRADVLLKLGEVSFRRGDYLSAQSHLEQAAAAQPGSPLAEKAQFLAAQAASRLLTESGTEQALEHYTDVARANGPLAYRARLAQALLLNALNRPREAIPVLESILSSDADESLRFAALIEKGDTYFLLGDSEPASYSEAIAAWRLAAEPETPARWRNQALVKIGAASEKLGEFPAALASYHSVLSAKNDQEPEYFWFYKAGFDAARILENENKAAEAIEIYERLAATEGPRAEEARERINSLRLENFLWED
jgi:tetratricopeptide (TPR) repeat protein